MERPDKPGKDRKPTEDVPPVSGASKTRKELARAFFGRLLDKPPAK
jgi:hypothetical protein